MIDDSCITLISAIIAAFIVAVGWFVTGDLNRKHDIATRRADHRISTLKNYVAFYIEAEKTKSLAGFNEIQVGFYLYGYTKEIELVRKIADIVTNEPANPEWLALMRELNILCRNNLREELGLEKVAEET